MLQCQKRIIKRVNYKSVARKLAFYCSKAGFISVRRPFVSKIIKYLPEQDIISLAEYVAKTANKDSLLLMRKEYSTKSAQSFGILDKNI